MAAQNPYDAPRSKVTGTTAAYGEIRILSTRGRIGRLRYIGYTVGLTMLIAIAFGVIAALVGRTVGPDAAVFFTIVSYVAIIIVTILLTIQRAHDFNSSGWLTLVAFIPLVNLIFWFIPGTDGENRFGPETPPNGAGVVALALILPAVFVVGIVAAVTIPAYQQYQQRAAAAQNK